MFLKIGHRGAKALEPENTLSAFARGINEGANAIEFDVRKTKNGALIVMHDDKVDRTTNGKGLVKGLSLKELKALDAGNGEKIPTLEEAIDFLKEKNVFILIELKEKGFEKKIIELIKEKGIQEKALVISFLAPALRKVKKLAPDVKTGLLFFYPLINPIKTALGLKVDFIGPFYRIASKQLIDEAHEAGLKVFVWNIDDLNEMKSLVDRGVDGIGSNDPRLFKDLKEFVE